MFEVVSLDRRLSKEDYRRRLPVYQRRLWSLQRLVWKSGLPTVLVFEGWDAAGKGDVIRKLTERLDPRGFDLHHVTDDPRTFELDLPWMWPFWIEVPPRGKIAIFDRSWNRRALRARVESPQAEMEWRRRLRDIGDFERWLVDDGYLIIKLFLHIDRKEQKKRYARWKKKPGESWKALEGFWQSPDRYDEYLAATEELLQNTEAGGSPWHVIAATDRRWARVQGLATIVSRFEAALEGRGVELPAAEDGDECSTE